MSRRKDHTPEAVKNLLFEEARKIIASKGLNGLTARGLAAKVGYAPGTIYNMYKDMDALVTAINQETLEQLYEECRSAAASKPADLSRLQALAYTYIDFAHHHKHAWLTLFSGERTPGSHSRLPLRYRQTLEALFTLIETSLHECLPRPHENPAQAARLLWTCLHGITLLTLDGRLKLIGVKHPHAMIDDLLTRYFADCH